MRATDVIGYAYHADTYCVAHGEALPDTDPEGNDKTPVFCGDEADRILRCAECGEVLDGAMLTDDGVRHELDDLLGADVSDRWARDAAADLLTVAAESLSPLARAYVQALADDTYPSTVAGTRAMLALADRHDGVLPAYVWPGGYPAFYIDADGAALCAACAGEGGCSEPVVAVSINYEDGGLYCDGCGGRIESAYADD